MEKVCEFPNCKGHAPRNSTRCSAHLDAELPVPWRRGKYRFAPATSWEHQFSRASGGHSAIEDLEKRVEQQAEENRKMMQAMIAYIARQAGDNSTEELDKIRGYLKEPADAAQ